MLFLKNKGFGFLGKIRSALRLLSNQHLHAILSEDSDDLAHVRRASGQCVQFLEEVLEIAAGDDRPKRRASRLTDVREGVWDAAWEENLSAFFGGEKLAAEHDLELAFQHVDELVLPFVDVRRDAVPCCVTTSKT